MICTKPSRSARLGRGSALALAALACAAFASPASAQKAKDTVRLAFHDSISSAEAYFDPKPETALTQTALFSTLIVYDPQSKEFKPDLAESWSRPAEKVLEFKLRKNVKFHDGSLFTADDVVGTINFLIDPASKLRFGANWSFIDHAEKIDDYTVRIYAKREYSSDLMQLAINTVIFPIKIFSTFEPRSDFGRKSAVGTGPYKLESFDSSKGIVLVKNPDFVSPGPWRPAASIGRVVITPMPDWQTQIAQLTTGGLDILHEVPKDQADMLAADPRLSLSVAPGLNFFYMWMDAVNRSGNAALSKVEVRRALAMALDRNSLARNIAPGGDKASVLNQLCVPTQVSCGPVTTPPPAYDVAGAKKLLADAGYPNGFDVSVISNPGSEQMSQAVAGELRKIGVRAQVEHLQFAAYRERQTGGKVQILVGSWSSGGVPDVLGTFGFFFDMGPRDYSRDPTIDALSKKASEERDPKAREALANQIFSRSNEMAYVIPLTTLPTVFAHTKELNVGTTSVNGQALDLYLLSWK